MFKDRITITKVFDENVLKVGTPVSWMWCGKLEYGIVKSIEDDNELLTLILNDKSGEYYLRVDDNIDRIQSKILD